jgi:hypothetical protein
VIKRKTNKAKRVDHSCRNHGRCPECRGNRLHAARKRERAAREQING